MLASNVLVFLTCLIGTYTHLGSAVISNETQIFNSLLLNYDKDASPYQITGKPTEVKISLYVYTIDLSSENSEMTFTCYLRMGWDDPRMVRKQSGANNLPNDIRLPDHSWEKIWIPDIFIRNAISTEYHETATPNRMIIWKSSGSLWYVAKVTVVSVCDSASRRYPFETVTCHLYFESFGHKMDSVTIIAAENSLDLSNDLKVHGFQPVLSASSDCSQNYTSGAYPCLDLSIAFKRASSFVSTVCIPSILIVIVSWISFWIDKDATTARLVTGFLSLITLTLLFIRSQKSPAFISQTTLFDIWFLVSFIFILVSILEYFLVVILSRKRSGCAVPSVELDSDVKGSKEADTGKRAAGWMDWISRIAFPVAFAIFVIVFFCL